MYSYVKATGAVDEKANGAKIYDIKKTIKHDSYQCILSNKKLMYHTVKMIKSQDR